MSEFIIKSETKNAQYEYKDTNIIVIGNYVKNAQTDKLTSIYGDCYRNVNGVQGDNFGYFNGYPSGDEMVYDLSQMKRADSNIVWDAIDDIEAEILTTEPAE